MNIGRQLEGFELFWWQQTGIKHCNFMICIQPSFYTLHFSKYKLSSLTKSQTSGTTLLVPLNTHVINVFQY
jgi:hypothetical protein